MKIIKLSNKKFYKLEKFIEKECDYILDRASDYIDTETANELIKNNESLFDLQEAINKVKR
mgnify:FL=1